MMVMRPSDLQFKSPTTSRGSSPGRSGTVRSRGSSPGTRRDTAPKYRGSSPGKATTPPGHNGHRSRARGVSPSGSDNFTRSSTLPNSRGSETGSLDRLDQSVAETPIKTHAGATVEDNINVVVRVRPLSGKEEKNGDDTVVQFPGNGQLVLDGEGGAAGNQKPKVFSYNVVFEPGATQEDVIQFSGIKRLIEMAVEGFSCTAFCYGQTGSGKTHTLTGPPGLFNKKNPDPYSEDHGLVFRSFMYLFKLLQERSDFHFVLKASFLEIYNEKVIDLLNPGSVRKPLAVRWSKKSRGFFVENLFTVDCEELDDLLAVLEEGMRNRSVGKHNMNEYSSRSHTILTVHITSEQQMGEDGVFISKQGKINFVDLAGSEMTKKTMSEGKTLEEANNINKSLMVLGYCIASLSDPKRKGGHIPYRDSKLTKLLADSLAGNGVTLMIACISPARYNVVETVNTLRYAARAKKIRTKPIVVMDPREALILSLKREVNALQSENDHLRTALNLPGGEGGAFPAHNVANLALGLSDTRIDKLGETVPGRVALTTPPSVDLDKLTELEGTELTDLVRHYLTENEALRRENAELFTTRELLIRDQDLVCRENERLLKKLEDVNSVCCRSPIIPARPTYSAEMLNVSMSDSDAFNNTNVWTNSHNGSTGSFSGVLTGPKFKQEILEGRLSTPRRLPDSIQKEMDKRRIGSSMNNIADTYRERSHRRNNSWDNEKQARGSSGSADSSSSSRKGKTKDLPDNNRSSPLRRISTAPGGDIASFMPKMITVRRPASLSSHTSLDSEATLEGPSFPGRSPSSEDGPIITPNTSPTKHAPSTALYEILDSDEDALDGRPLRSHDVRRVSYTPLRQSPQEEPSASGFIATSHTPSTSHNNPLPLPPISTADLSIYPPKRSAKAIIDNLKTALFPPRPQLDADLPPSHQSETLDGGRRSTGDSSSKPDPFGSYVSLREDLALM